MPLGDRGVSGFRGLFALLWMAVMLVLLMACANVANLLLTRGTAREKELNVRAALGAAKSRLVRQLITESILLSICGGLLGIGVGYVGICALRASAPVELPDLQRAGLHAPVVMVATALAVLTGFLFGSVLAMTLAGKSLYGSLQAMGRTSTLSVRATRIKAALAIGEIALTLTLLL